MMLYLRYDDSRITSCTYSEVSSFLLISSSYLPAGLLITVPVVSDMSTNGNSNDDCSSGSGGGSPDAAGSDGVGKKPSQPLPNKFLLTLLN